MNAFLQSLFFIAIAEMGDKSQLAALAFATRFKPLIVLSAIFAATLLVHLFSVFIGEALTWAIPDFWIAIAAGLAFIAFGIWTLRGDSLNDDTPKHSRLGAFLSVGITFFIAELGDKTMLATVTLASQHQSFVPVWIGSTLGMVAADALAIVVGIVLGKRLPERVIKCGAAIIFIGTGVVTIALAFR